MHIVLYVTSLNRTDRYRDKAANLRMACCHGRELATHFNIENLSPHANKHIVEWTL